MMHVVPEQRSLARDTTACHSRTTPRKRHIAAADRQNTEKNDCAACADASDGDRTTRVPTFCTEILLRYRQGNVLQTLQQMEQTIAVHSELASFAGTTGDKALTAAIADLIEHSSSQQAGVIGSRGETARSRSLRAELRAIHVQPIVSAARICAVHNPALASVTMPGSRLRTQALLAATLGIIETAHANEAALIDAGLPPTFLADVDAAITRLRTSLDDRAHYGSRRTGATVGLLTTEGRAREVIKIVDAQMRTLIGDNAPLLAEWKSSIRICSFLS